MKISLYKIFSVRMALFVAIALFASGVLSRAQAEPASDVTTIMFVRHAEKDSLPADDPHLTAQGRKHAQELATTLGKAGITSIVTSQYARTKETASQLADALGIELTVIPVIKDPSNPKIITPGSYDAVVSHVRKNEGRTILVVGHSNTVPEMIRMLGGPGDIAIPEDAFDRMYVVVMKGKETLKVVTLRYGGGR